MGGTRVWTGLGDLVAGGVGGYAQYVYVLACVCAVAPAASAPAPPTRPLSSVPPRHAPPLACPLVPRVQLRRLMQDDSTLRGAGAWGVHQKWAAAARERLEEVANKAGGLFVDCQAAKSVSLKVSSCSLAHAAHNIGR